MYAIEFGNIQQSGQKGTKCNRDFNLSGKNIFAHKCSTLKLDKSQICQFLASKESLASTFLKQGRNCYRTENLVHCVDEVYFLYLYFILMGGILTCYSRFKYLGAYNFLKKFCARYFEKAIS